MAISEPEDRTVLRPSWISTCSIPVMVSILVAVLAFIGDVGMQFPVVFCVVFSCVFVLLDRRRSLELGPNTALRRGAPRPRSMDRADVRSVVPGSWWRGGITMRATGRSMWIPIGDRPFGYVSTKRLSVVQQWAIGRASENRGQPNQ